MQLSLNIDLKRKNETVLATPDTKRPKKEFDQEEFIISGGKLIQTTLNMDITELEIASKKFYELKKCIPINVLLSGENTLNNIYFLLKVIHPCPIDLTSRDFEIQIFDKIVRTCSNYRTKEFKKISQKILLDLKPGLIYDQAALMSQKTSLEINNLELEIENIQEITELQEKYKALFALYDQEIVRFVHVYNVYSPLQICDGFNFAHLSLGKCYRNLALTLLDAQRDLNLDFSEKAKLHFQKAEKYFNFCVKYLTDYPETGSQELRDEVKGLVEECRTEIKKLIPIDAIVVEWI